MELKKLIKQVESAINEKMVEFNKVGKEIKELNLKIDDLTQKMYNILNELEPVEYIVRQQNPQMCKLFDNLKEQYKK